MIKLCLELNQRETNLFIIIKVGLEIKVNVNGYFDSISSNMHFWIIFSWLLFFGEVVRMLVGKLKSFIIVNAQTVLGL